MSAVSVQGAEAALVRERADLAKRMRALTDEEREAAYTQWGVDAGSKVRNNPSPELHLFAPFRSDLRRMMMRCSHRHDGNGWCEEVVD